MRTLPSKPAVRNAAHRAGWGVLFLSWAFLSLHFQCLIVFFFQKSVCIRWPSCSRQGGEWCLETARKWRASLLVFLVVLLVSPRGSNSINRTHAELPLSWPPARNSRSILKSKYPLF